MFFGNRSLQTLAAIFTSGGSVLLGASVNLAFQLGCSMAILEAGSINQARQEGVLIEKEEGELVVYMFKMVSIGHPQNIDSITLEGGTHTQERDTPFKASI